MDLCYAILTEPQNNDCIWIFLILYPIWKCNQSYRSFLLLSPQATIRTPPKTAVFWPAHYLIEQLQILPTWNFALRLFCRSFSSIFNWFSFLSFARIYTARLGPQTSNSMRIANKSTTLPIHNVYIQYSDGSRIWRNCLFVFDKFIYSFFCMTKKISYRLFLAHRCVM